MWVLWRWTWVLWRLRLFLWWLRWRWRLRGRRPRRVRCRVWVGGCCRGWAVRLRVGRGLMVPVGRWRGLRWGLCVVMGFVGAG